MKSKRITLLLLLALIGLMLAAPMARAQEAKVIKIASQSPLSGPQSVLGTGIRNAVELAIEQLSGPIKDMGYSVEFVPFDDQADPNVGPANAQNIVNDPAILAVIGHLNSGVAIPSSEVYDSNDLVMVSPANTNVNITDRALPTVNRICGRDDTQGQAGAAFVTSDLKDVKSVYVLHDTTAYGQGIAEFFRAEAERQGLTVLGFEGTAEAANFDGVVQPILALNPDLIYFGGIYSQTGIFINQARAAGFQGVFMGPDGFDSTEFAKLAGDAAIGTYYTTVAAPVNLYPDAAQFAADYKTKFGEDPQPFGAQSYDSTGIVLHAIEIALRKTGGAMPSRKLVGAMVRDTHDYKGITSTYTFDAVGDPEIGLYYIIHVTSSDPNEWGNNELLSSLQVPSPLKFIEQQMAGGS